jgi:hypothetical protein
LVALADSPKPITSTRDTGLFGTTLAIAKRMTGIRLKVAQGADKALDTGRLGRRRRGVRACQLSR